MKTLTLEYQHQQLKTSHLVHIFVLSITVLLSFVHSSLFLFTILYFIIYLTITLVNSIKRRSLLEDDKPTTELDFTLSRGFSRGGFTSDKVAPSILDIDSALIYNISVISSIVLSIAGLAYLIK